MNSLTPDSQAIALLSTTLGSARGAEKPLSPTEWSSLAATLQAASMRPADLLTLGADEIVELLSLPRTAAERMAGLLRRGGQLALELEHLASRGITILTRADDSYPKRLKDHLRRGAPPALFVAGRIEIAAEPAAAVIGSRDADGASLEFATVLGRRLAADGTTVVSGAARGIDTTSMVAALDAGGNAVGVVADALEKAIRRQEFRQHIADGSLLLISPYHPSARFTVGTAMRRNRLIYCLSQAAFVVASGETGGTREGALENMKSGWVPLYVRGGADAPLGNKQLLNAGAIEIDREILDRAEILGHLPERDEQLQVGRTTADRQTAASEPSDPAPDTTPVDVTTSDAFALVWPALSGFLDQPRSLAEVRERLAIEPSQARAWLARGVNEGLLATLDRPRRYQLVRPPHPSLFDD